MQAAKKTFLLALMFIPAALHAQTWTCGPTLEAVSLEQRTRFIPENIAAHTPAKAGWDLTTGPDLMSATSCAASRSFFFSAPMAEGNYTVTVVVGSDDASVTTIKAEARRLMARNVTARADGEQTVQFNVNVRGPNIAGGGQVRRKPREIDSLDWDSKLTLEFAGDRPSVRSITIAPVKKNPPTVYLAGDSTVVDQETEPWAAWGQMLPSFFGTGVTIANDAESGETIASFESELRFAKIFSTLRKGDYLLFQFAHNDMKPGPGYVSPEKYVALLRNYIAMARERGATPVLVTSTNRRTFAAGGDGGVHITDSLAPYPQTMRDLAASDHVALIDLNAMSKTLYEAIGEPDSRSLFVYAAAGTYPGQTEALHDDTHFNSYGAYELARCVVLGMQQAKLPLVKFLRAPNAMFDPAHPDAPAAVALPPTPFVDLSKPYER